MPPIYSYDHSVWQSITGGYVYRGEGEALQGQYFFADFSQGKLFTLRFDGAAWVATERTSQLMTDVGFVTNPKEERRLKDTKYRDEIALRFPRHWRRVCGYNLDELIKDGPLNMARVIVGSEGTFLTVVEAKMILTAREDG